MSYTITARICQTNVEASSTWSRSLSGTMLMVGRDTSSRARASLPWAAAVYTWCCALSRRLKSHFSSPLACAIKSSGTILSLASNLTRLRSPYITSATIIPKGIMVSIADTCVRARGHPMSSESWGLAAEVRCRIRCSSGEGSQGPRSMSSFPRSYRWAYSFSAIDRF